MEKNVNTWSLHIFFSLAYHIGAGPFLKHIWIFIHVWFYEFILGKSKDETLQVYKRFYSNLPILCSVSGRDFFFNGIINVLTPNRVMLFLYEVDIFVAIDDDREEVESYFLTFGTRVDPYTIYSL